MTTQPLPARQENNERLWKVMEAYKDDTEGVTSHEAITLAEFVPESGLTKKEIFNRAMRVCKKRAEKQGMMIPRATLVGRRGYAYVLASRASSALEGYMAQERVSEGVQRSTVKHEVFIERNLGSLPPTLQEIFKQSIEANQDYEEFKEARVKKERENRDAFYKAWLEEQQMKAESI